MSEVLQVRGLHTRIHSETAVVHPLDGIDLTLTAGETFAIVGESGSGKSMTALSIMRLLPEPAWIEAGSVMLDGRNVLALPEYRMRDVRGARIGMIFQEPATSLNPVLTCGEQIIEVLERHKIEEGAAARRRATEWLKRVGIPDPERRMDEYPFQLSGGMKQRVMIALALAAEPEVLIADEPTTALDVTIQAQILDLLKSLQRERGMALLLITHDLGVVAQMAHRVALMYAGEIVKIGPRDEFFAQPLHPYALKLFASLPGAGKRGEPLASIKGFVPPLHGQFTGCRFTDRCDYAFERCPREAPAWHGPTPEHQARCHLLDPAEQSRLADILLREEEKVPEVSEFAVPPAAGELLEVRDLKVHFPIRKGLFKRIVGHVKAVDGVSLSIKRGRTLALVGESGCGKTTAGKALLQLVPVTGGSVRFGGTEVLGLKGAELKTMRSHMQLVFQDPFASLNPRMRVGEIIAEGMASFGIGENNAARAARVAELLQQVGLPVESRYRYPHEFSGGQRQRIAVARALAVNPQLIVCDEPTSALDVSVQAQILNLLKELQKSLGVSYLFITHNIGVVEYLAHDVAVMYLGRIVESGTADEVLRNPRHPYTQALLAAVPRVATGRKLPPLSNETKERLLADVPSPANPPAGCHFHTRCPLAVEACKAAYPAEVAVSATHKVRCIMVQPAAANPD
ncbi:MAG TPA: dipeptide ABC transporter ATP-binding protein [Burkholderiales bacterium]|jgi:peptide/nickel transport system ATP-binding protein